MLNIANPTIIYLWCSVHLVNFMHIWVNIIEHQLIFFPLLAKLRVITIWLLKYVNLFCCYITYKIIMNLSMIFLLHSNHVPLFLVDKCIWIVMLLKATYVFFTNAFVGSIVPLTLQIAKLLRLGWYNLLTTNNCPNLSILHRLPRVQKIFQQVHSWNCPLNIK